MGPKGGDEMFKSMLFDTLVLLCGVILLTWISDKNWIGILVIVYAAFLYFIDIFTYLKTKKRKKEVLENESVYKEFQD